MGQGVEFWRPHVAAMVRQRRTPAEYASEHALVAGTLKWWRSKLRDEFGPKAPQVPPNERFVAVRVREAQVAPPSGGVMLTVGCDVRVHLPGLPAPQWLAALAHAVSERR